MRLTRKYSKWYIILSVIGVVMSVVPALIATLTQFPIWIETSSTATVSGATAFLLILSAYPVFKIIKKYMKTPSAPIIWLILCVVMFVLRKIADQMFVVTVVGAISNILAFLLYKLRDIKFPVEKDIV